MSESTHLKLETVHFPDQFQGVFRRTKPRFQPLLAEARAKLRALDVPATVRPYYEFAVLDRPQPAFMLLPIMYLATAEQHGGITERHKALLPSYMLAMELAAVVDDTVDRTPKRSNFLSYPERFCEASAASFSGFLVAKSLEMTAEVAPEVLPLAARLFQAVCATETWELYARYPAVDDVSLRSWLHNRYHHVTPFIEHSFNMALRLNGREEIGVDACRHFAEVAQDVDDVVNLVERRELIGENDDLKLGIVSSPLVETVACEPDARDMLEAYWRPYRSIRIEHRQDFLEGMAQCSREHEREYADLAALVRARGVPRTMDKIFLDVDASVDLSPAPLRETVRDVALSYLDRLRELDRRADIRWSDRPPPRAEAG
ncbi:MAG: polyprenyl synthetase family protein [Myxococcales bacterium]|nr:polyprenyl synthetase family protein [Myxococcales bacterium]